MIKGFDRMQPRARAWLCIVFNQLAFPGLGTILVGRRVGYAQATLMVAGFILATGFIVWFIVCSIRYAMNPAWDETEFKSTYQPFQWALRYGLALCAVAWVWALISSVAIWRRMRSESKSS